MNNISHKIYETPEWGVILQITDPEGAGAFDDFLSENCYVLVQIKFENDGVSFLFGQAGAHEKVRELFERFTDKWNSPVSKNS
jgi:hypothetical protein